MASKLYIPKPIEAYIYKQGDDAQRKELEKLGITPSDVGGMVTGPSGNTLNIDDGDYIAVDAAGDVRVYGKDYFERSFVEFKK